MSSNKINFTSFAMRAKEQGEEIIIFSRKPQMSVYSTVTDRQIAAIFGEAMCFVAATLAQKSNGRVKPEEIFNSLLKHCQDTGAEKLSEFVTQVKEQEAQDGKPSTAPTDNVRSLK